MYAHKSLSCHFIRAIEILIRRNLSEEQIILLDIDIDKNRCF